MKRLALLAVGAVTLAALATHASADAPATQPAQRYSITLVGDTAILLDTATGESWMMNRSGPSNASWYPMRKFSDMREALRSNMELRGGPAGRQPLEPPGDR